MAEAALARREARRRKILNNSYNRLQIISGKSDNELWKEPSNIISIPRGNAENSVPKECSSSSSIIEHTVNNGVINAGEESSNFLSTNLESALNDGDVTVTSSDAEPFISVNSATPTLDPPLTLWEIFTIYSVYKYDIVFLAWFLQILYYFSVMKFEGQYFFLPLILYVSTKYVLFPNEHSSNIANVFLLLNGMSASRAQKIMYISQYITDFFQDVCIFLFTNICISSLWQYIECGVL